MSLQPLESVNVVCPYCGETIEAEIDTSINEQHYIEDCHVCCSPIVFLIRIGDVSEQIDVSVHRENE